MSRRADAGSRYITCALLAVVQGLREKAAEADHWQRLHEALQKQVQKARGHAGAALHLAHGSDVSDSDIAGIMEQMVTRLKVMPPSQLEVLSLHGQMQPLPCHPGKNRLSIGCAASSC